MPLNISKVEVQGAKDAKEWPYKFCLSYSLNQSQFTEARTQESSCSVRHLFLFFCGDRTSSHYRSRVDVTSREFEVKYQSPAKDRVWQRFQIPRRNENTTRGGLFLTNVDVLEMWFNSVFISWYTFTIEAKTKEKTEKYNRKMSILFKVSYPNTVMVMI